MAFMQNATVKQTLDLARKADVALVGIGDMSENSYMVDSGWFTPDEVVQSRLKQGVVGTLRVMTSLIFTVTLPTP